MPKLPHISGTLAGVLRQAGVSAEEFIAGSLSICPPRLTHLPCHTSCAPFFCFFS